MKGGPAVDRFSVRAAAEPRSFQPTAAAASVQVMPSRSEGHANVIPIGAAGRTLPLPEPRFYERAGKRVFDIAFSLTFLTLVGSWLYPLVGLAIRLDSAGPVFFRQRRVGLEGKTFVCWKFRTMEHRPDAGFVQASKGDSRITRVGNLLRRTNLDEVPQFINVLLGNMSVIGPRPHVAELDAMFRDLIPAYDQRTAVKPGVSGLAQVSGCRGETRRVREMNHRIRFDLFYCRNVSFWLDLKLIVLTVMRALQGDKKAY
ncbi:sugar transferase [Solimonas marina]|uniref:Sugar transferase n=1 Tax=Solimonas marina TaxID=2714601 RepID=A0A969W8J9_9GAMM|nr:sugar transferase [Solimonas marina]NKF21884.1 sugar transferase [Solimonas marina]